MVFKSIEAYKKLLETRTHVDDWALNLIEAEKLIESEEEGRHFYHFIMNPEAYDPKTVHTETLGDAIDKGLCTNIIEPYPEHMKMECYNNGLETFVYVRNTSEADAVMELIDDMSLDDDEKKPMLL